MDTVGAMMCDDGWSPNGQCVRVHGNGKNMDIHFEKQKQPNNHDQHQKGAMKIQTIQSFKKKIATKKKNKVQ